METEHERVEAQLKALYNAFRKQEEVLEDRSVQFEQLQELLKRAVHRIRYAETLPGRREPFAISFEIEVPLAAGAGTLLTNPQLIPATNVGTPLSAVQRVAKDGPFVATTYLSAFKLKTYSLGPLDGTPPEVPNGTDPAIGVEVITPLTGRFRPIASSSDPFSGAYIGPNIGVLNVSDTTDNDPDGGAFFTRTFRVGSIDFLWGIEDVNSVRLRQNGQAPIPSRFLHSEFDRPLYLPVADYYERGASIRFNAQLLHDLGYVEMNWNSYTTTSAGAAAAGDQVWTELFNAETDTALSDADLFAAAPLASRARRRFGLGGTLYFTMLGYKILQPMEPAV